MNEKITELELDKLVAGQNDRREFPEAEIRELADSIAEHGLAQPITVRWVVVTDQAGELVPDASYWQIVAGERRYRAFQMLGRKTIPAIAHYAMSDKRASAIMLAENVNRADLNPLDEANAYASRMQQFGLSAEEVASWAKVNVDRVKSRLALLELKPDAQLLVKTGQLPLAHAAMMAGLDVNRQVIALRFFNEAERQPTVEQFRNVVGELKAQQAQDAMFDVDNFLVIQLEGHKEAVRAREVNVATDPTLPRFDYRLGSTGEVLAAYIEQLEALGKHKEALVVGTVLAELLRCNLLGRRVKVA